MNTLLTQFHFLRPEWLMMIIPVLILCLLLWRTQARSSDWQRVISPELLPYLLDMKSRRARRWPVLLLAIGGTLASIAMAGPVWERLPQPVFRSDAALVIALDLRGKAWDTQELSTQMDGWLSMGRDVVLLIGGPEGLSAECFRLADASWSLSRLTLPHPMVRILVAEQLYRAWSILKNHPYHR